MRATLTFGNAQPTRDTRVIYMNHGLNLLRDSQRRTCSHPDFPDVGSQRRPMAHLAGTHHITEMSNVNTSLRVFIADDSPLIRARVVSIFGASAMTTVGLAETPQDSIEGHLTMYSDVVVLDVQLEGKLVCRCFDPFVAQRHTSLSLSSATARTPVIASVALVRALRIILTNPKNLTGSHRPWSWLHSIRILIPKTNKGRVNHVRCS